MNSGACLMRKTGDRVILCIWKVNCHRSPIIREEPWMAPEISVRPTDTR